MVDNDNHEPTGFPTVDTPEPGQKFHLNGQ